MDIDSLRNPGSTSGSSQASQDNTTPATNPILGNSALGNSIPGNSIPGNTPSTTDLIKALGIPAKPRVRRVWTPEEDEKLRLLVSRYGDQCGRNSCWHKISAGLENRSSKDCRKRWFHSLDPKLKRGRWTVREDQILIEAYNRLGPAWHKISQLIPGRTDDQCSKRYNDVLDPKISERLREWTPEEDQKLLDLVNKHGTQWRDIVKEMPGRTGLTCRNRWRKLVSPVVRKNVPRRAKELAKEQEKSRDNPQNEASDKSGDEVDSEGPSEGRSEGGRSEQMPMQLSPETLPLNQVQLGQSHLKSHSQPRSQPQMLGQLPPAKPSQEPNQYGTMNTNNSDMGPQTHTNTTKRTTYTLESNGVQRTLTAADVEAILMKASMQDQKVVIMQHNYHYHYHYDSKNTEIRPQGNPVNPVNSQGYTVGNTGGNNSGVSAGNNAGTQEMSAQVGQNQFPSFPASSSSTPGFGTPRMSNGNGLSNVIPSGMPSGMALSPLYSMAMFQRLGISPGASESPQPEGLYHNESGPPTTPGFLELELMDMEEDVFGQEGGDDTSLDLDDFHIPFNPS